MEQEKRYGQDVDRVDEKTPQPAQRKSGMVKVRRVGSVTLGLTLICYGILFLLHIFMPELEYSAIFRLWPVVFILLGGEILIEDHVDRRGDKYRFVYDFPAVLMLGAMLLFAMVMAVIDYAVAHGGNIIFL